LKVDIEKQRSFLEIDAAASCNMAATLKNVHLIRFLFPPSIKLGCFTPPAPNVQTSHPKPIVDLKCRLSDLTTVSEKYFMSLSFFVISFWVSLPFFLDVQQSCFLCFVSHLFDSFKAWIKDLFRGCIFHVGDQGFMYLFVYKITLVRATYAPGGSFQCLL